MTVLRDLGRWLAVFTVVFVSLAVINGLAPLLALAAVTVTLTVALRARHQPLPRLGLGSCGRANAALIAAGLALLGVVAGLVLPDATTIAAVQAHLATPGGAQGY